MVNTKRDREQAIFLAGAQGLFYALAGIWPLVNLRTFEAVTGPKSDRWLVKTTGLLIAVIGTTLVISARRGRIPPEVALLGGGAAAGLGTSALVYALRGRISKIYLVDAAIELGLATAWIGLRSRAVRAERQSDGAPAPPQGCGSNAGHQIS
ncbi:hypothetical protein [Sorangium atrum]|uniref:Uncharacterized protein n=1 Tax=Sorangium atrum TaxID=2995308 RepID=A0ABT5C4N5_9BACT|nr:hypothetical protein [Sorangium aterium]MDC0681379.1 hypothetical protein [Sorangium aterium]